MRTFPIPREQIEELIAYLAATYPKAFFTLPSLKRPLKKNILLDLERDRVLDDEKREAALNFYQRDWNYEDTLIAGAKRIDLNGKVVGTVTEQEQLEAQKRVAEQKRQRREKMKSEIEVIHKPQVPAMATKPKPPEPELPEPVELTQLRALWANIDSVLSKTEDGNLRSALTAAALKIFIGEATKLVAALEGAMK